MSEAASPPLAPAALDRDRAAIHHFDSDGASEASRTDCEFGLTPLAPLMVAPDPRYRHGDIDVIEARLAAEKATRASAVGARSEPAPRKATEHPLIATLISTLPAPGAAWPLGQREVWLKAAASIFDMTYETGEGDDEAPEAI